jgi:hypothetical protein
MEQYASIKTVPGASKGAVYVVIADNEDLLVAIKPEAGMVYFDTMRRFFQIGFRIHVRPQPGKTLPPRDEVQAMLNVGTLATRNPDDGGGARYVGQVRIPACNLTLSPWVVQDHIAQDHLIERLVHGLYERLTQSGKVTIVTSEDMLIEVARERFLDMIPDNKVPLPEQKVYFGKESYYPPEGEGPPPSITGDDPFDPPASEGEGGDHDNPNA